MTVSEFWDMTPREMFMALNAAVWRIEQEQARMVTLAWYTAALQRSKTMPTLAKLLAPMEHKPPVPIEERRKEFEEMKELWPQQVSSAQRT